MVRTLTSKADWSQHLSLARKLYSQLDDNGQHIHSSSTVVASLKLSHYIVNGRSYQATRVSAMLAGMEESQVVEPVVSNPVAIINAGLADGTLKYTKTKLVHIPK